MSIYQEFRQSELAKELARAGTLRVWPLLESSDSSLNNQPTVHALSRVLRGHAHVKLVGPAGSGKTILSLHLAGTNQPEQFAYLEAQRWAPQLDGDLLTQFLTVAGCEVASAQKALAAGQLGLILDAIDEAPWRAGGASLPEAVNQLANQIQGRAGLLITSRLSAYLPNLKSPSVEARLAGIRKPEIEQFLAVYASDRSRVARLVQILDASSFPDNVKYSPLVLRLLAEVLEVDSLFDNIIQLFEFVSDRYIRRECGKVRTQGAAPPAGTWQSCYADLSKHQNFISGLLYSRTKSQQVMTEEEFSEAVRTLLSPEQLQARALVDLSTVMSQHPLLPVACVSQGNADHYKINYDHDWVRSALLPKFLENTGFDAQIFASDTWHNTFPPPDDFCTAWRYMGTNRAKEILENLLGLAASQDQYIFLCRWLLLQMFNQDFAMEHSNSVFSTISKAAFRCIPSNSNLISATELEQSAVGQLEIHDATLDLLESDQLANLAGVTLSKCNIHLGRNYSTELIFDGCILDKVLITLDSRASLRLERSFLLDVTIKTESDATATVSDSTYDPAHCLFDDQVVLVECRKADIQDMIFVAYALATILRRFVGVKNPGKPEASL